MKNTDFMNLSLPEGADKIDVEILNSDFTAIENLLKQHAIIETMTLNGEGVLIGAIGPYIRLQNIDTVQVSVDIGKETFTLDSGENVIIRETAENIGIITSGNVHITYFVNPKTYSDKEFYTKKKVDELLSKVEGNVEVDAELSETSENPVQNKVINAKFKEYYNSEEVNELIDGIGTPEDVYTKTETDNLVNVKANANDVYTKEETINAIIEKVAELVAGAPEDFDTLKELSDWLIEHEDSAATMNSAIQKNATDIATANENIEKKLDKKATCKNGADYNSFVKTGFFEVLGKTSTPTQNAPDGNNTNNNFYLIVQQRAASYVSQFAISARDDTGVYVRTMSNNTWNAWRKLLDNTTKYAASDEVGGAAAKVKTVKATSNTNRAVVFSDISESDTGSTIPYVDPDMHYNPATNTLTVPNIKSDTTATLKNDVAINKSALGMKCKNLLPYRCVPHSNSGGIKVAVADDGVVTLSGTNTVPFTYNINFTTPMVFDRDVFIVGAETLKNVIYNCKVDIKVNGSDYPAIGTAGLRIPAGTTISYLYFQQQTTNKEIEATIAPMIVYADVLDKTYEPYKPSLQEQINTLLARIEALEGTTNTTTEGGE